MEEKKGLEKEEVENKQVTGEVMENVHEQSKEKLISKDTETSPEKCGDLISLEEIPRKGVGCVAVMDLGPGTLVLREEPALYVTPDIDGHAETISAFAELSIEEQNKVLELYNAYTMQEGLWTKTMRKELDVCVDEAGDISYTGVPTETALKVWQIWLTNAYDQGIFLLLSRFNHSCQPNTEYFWNTDLEVWALDVRTVRQVRTGEELTVCYRSFWPNTTRERQAMLRESYSFDCSCEGCDISEEELRKEVEDCKKFKDLDDIKQRSKASEDLECCLLNIKKMLLLSKEIKTISLKNVLSMIIEEGFEVAFEIFESAGNSKESLHDVELFASLGLNLSTLLHGENHSVTQEWVQRTKQTIKVS